MSLEVIRFRPEIPTDTKVVLVSGFGNETEFVRGPHEDVAEAWMKEGHEVVLLHPDWPNGDGQETVNAVTREIRDWTTASQEKFVVGVGTSAGGVPVLAAGVEIAKNSPELLERTGFTTICTRSDLIGADVNGLRNASPMLVRLITSLNSDENKKQLSLVAPRTLAVTAGDSDGRVPYGSSVLNGSRELLLPGARRHVHAVGAALRDFRNQLVQTPQAGRR